MRANLASEQQKIISELRFKSESEQRLNKVVYDKLLGTKVKYGQTIQLCHIKSKKFITVSSAAVLDMNLGQVHVVLAAGSAQSHLTVLPRFKLRNKGDMVQLSDKVSNATWIRFIEIVDLFE